MAEQIDAHALDIDVAVSRKVFRDVQDLADIYGFGYLLLQRTHDTYNICIQYEQKFESEINAFIEDVNKIRLTII